MSKRIILLVVALVGLALGVLMHLLNTNQLSEEVIALSRPLFTMVVFVGIGWMLIALLPSSRRSKIAAFVLLPAGIAFTFAAQQFKETIPEWASRLIAFMPIAFVVMVVGVAAYERWGTILTQLGYHERAMKYYHRRLERTPGDVLTLRERGQLYAQQGNYVAAIADYSAALALKPDHIRLRGVNAEMTSLLLNDRAVAYIETGQFDEALADFSEAQRRNPQETVLAVNVAMLYLRKGDFTSAIQYYDRVLERKVEPMAAGLAYSNRGLARALQGDADGALQDFEAGLRLPLFGEQRAFVHGTLYDARGKLYFQMGRYHEALADFTHAHELQRDPANFVSLVGMAAAHQALDQTAQAQDWWKLHTSHNPRYADPEAIARARVCPPATIEALRTLAANAR